jgi:diacylglycerol kinase
MQESSKFSIQARLKSFSFAIEGLKTFFIQEHNARIHFLAALFAILLGLLLGISKLEWIGILFAIAFVLCTEVINTAIEGIANFISPEIHLAIKNIKDLAAAAVLIAAICAAIVGGIIFLPKIYSLFI